MKTNSEPENIALVLRSRTLSSSCRNRSFLAYLLSAWLILDKITQGNAWKGWKGKHERFGRRVCKAFS